jgi:hypothetical protein
VLAYAQKKTLAPALCDGSAKHANDGKAIYYSFATAADVLVDGGGEQPIVNEGISYWLNTMNLTKHRGAVTFASGTSRHLLPSGSGVIKFPFDSTLRAGDDNEIDLVTTFTLAKILSAHFPADAFWWQRRMKYIDHTNEVVGSELVVGSSCEEHASSHAVCFLSSCM